MTDMPTMRAAFRTTVSGGGKYEMVFRFPSMDAMHAADDEWRASLPIPEAPASVGPVADDVRRLVIAAREAWEVMGDCSADASYSANLDKALEAFSSRVLYENEPDAIGSNFGNGGGFDPVENEAVTILRATFERWLEKGPEAQPRHKGGLRPWSTGDLKWLVEQLSQPLYAAPPSPGFGGGDLREALRRIASSKTELSDKSDYARGWNDARFTMGQIARQALEASR